MQFTAQYLGQGKCTDGVPGISMERLKQNLLCFGTKLNFLFQKFFFELLADRDFNFVEEKLNNNFNYSLLRIASFMQSIQTFTANHPPMTSR